MKQRPATGCAEGGMTLIEMMVAMLIGTILIGGAITVYTQSQANYRTADSMARLQENVRFALDSLEPDIQLARFWGLTNEPGLIDATGPQVSCAGATNAQATDFAFALRQLTAVEARDDQYDLDCPGRNPRLNSDVLVVRHASPRQNALSVGQVQIESNISGGDLFDDGISPNRDPPREIRDVVVNAYYIGESNFDPNLPALRRLSLVDGGAQGRLVDQEVIPGVENLQVQFGLDTDGDPNGNVDRYVDGDNPLAVPAAGNRIVAVRLWLLVRAETNETGQGFRDDRLYAPADANLAPIQPGVTAGYPDSFRRIAVSKTIFLRNSGVVGGV
jgi:type IV pilus assembly protein PilW